jgi:hypothetical protein
MDCLTHTILKCLFNYAIKIYQNIAYLLTIQKPYNVLIGIYLVPVALQMQLTKAF